MAQFARPDSDVTLTRFDSPFWSRVDEVTPDDTTTEQRSEFNTASGALYELTLSSVTDPVSSSGHILRVRHFSTPTLVSNQILIELRQGASTVIASGTFDATTSYVTYTIALSGAEADNITDYTDLRVRGTTQATTNERLVTTWIEFEVPDAGGADTEDKRRSAMTPLAHVVMPDADNTIAALDRQQAAWIYSGIAAAGAPAGPAAALRTLGITGAGI